MNSETTEKRGGKSGREEKVEHKQKLTGGLNNLLGSKKKVTFYTQTTKVI